MVLNYRESKYQIEEETRSTKIILNCIESLNWISNAKLDYKIIKQKTQKSDSPTHSKQFTRPTNFS